jgi:hypothetical protein
VGVLANQRARAVDGVTVDEDAVLADVRVGIGDLGIRARELSC